MIEDYPYGRLRCRRRVWLENNPKHGFRFVSQTEHPTRKVWNKPHASTYVNIAACLYLDEQGYVCWAGIHDYTEATEALDFAQTFGPRCEGSFRLCAFAERHAIISYLVHRSGIGKAHVTINGAKQERSETQQTADLEESKVWLEIARLMAQSDIPRNISQDTSVE
jgi:hypothetical protein